MKILSLNFLLQKLLDKKKFRLRIREKNFIPNKNLCLKQINLCVKYDK